MFPSTAVAGFARYRSRPPHDRLEVVMAEAQPLPDVEALFVVARKGLADLLGQRLGGELRLVALAAQLLHRHVARGVDLGPRDDPRWAVLVPDPNVLHLQVEERIARLGHVLEVELVAEVRCVLRQHAVAEEAEDGRVLLLEAKLELGLELVELVQMAHAGECSAVRRVRIGPCRGTTSAGSSSASGSSANRRSCSRGCGTRRPGSSIVSSP